MNKKIKEITMNNKKMVRLDVKNLAKYFCENNSTLNPIQICQFNKISLDTYYRWKSIFNHFSSSEIENFFEIDNNESHGRVYDK